MSEPTCQNCADWFARISEIEADTEARIKAAEQERDEAMRYHRNAAGFLAEFDVLKAKLVAAEQREAELRKLTVEMRTADVEEDSLAYYADMILHALASPSTPSPAPSAEPMSRSRLKREAVQRGEPMPTFAPERSE